ncbi:hypothetical protein R80B4_00863 [Fibrobacteres bacterium R8-0-B4]
MNELQKHPIVARIEYLRDVVECGSLRDFLAKTGIPRNSFNMWIHRNRPPKRESLEKICEAYGVSMEWIKGNGDISEYTPKASTAPMGIAVDSVGDRITKLEKDIEWFKGVVESQQKTIESHAKTIENLSEWPKSGVPPIRDIYSNSVVRG